MTILELSFTSAEHQLSVRKFSIDEAISTTFKIAIEAVSPDDDLDLEAIVGKPVMFRMVSGSAWVTSDTRVWTGVVSEMELLRTEPGGLSTYALTLEPTLWLLTQRVNNRLFQHLSVPEIAKKLLDEWKIRVDLRVDETRHPKLELRVQYAENDYAFFCRQLEEAGISFYFEDDGGHGSQLVLTDGPHRNEPRAGGAIRFVDDPSLARAAEHEYLTAVRVGNKVRPGRLTIRDFDFRRPGLSLHSESVVQHDVEGMLEQYHYIPGAFHHEGHQGGETPTADDKGVARAHHTAGQRRADRRLEGHRAG
ncbi:MAG: type VI secretion system tip protein VgrG, partial [Minicystis sp.]